MKSLTFERLLRDRALIDGRWIGAGSGATFDVFNPSTNECLGSVPDMDAGDVKIAIEAAVGASLAWKALTAHQRGQILRRWYDAVMENQEALAQLMTAEQGKPLKEARGEIAYAASFIEWFSEEAKRVYGDVIPTDHPGKRLIVTKEPIGVVAAITPWNFPAAMVTRKAAAALAAGCTMVLKPSESTPYSALALAALAQEAGVPAGVLNVVTSDATHAPAIGALLCGDPSVQKITFTGSTEVGRILLRQSAETVKKCSMELGGNAPFIVFDDADIELALEGALFSKFRNAGQTCVCTNRFLVQSGIYTRFVEHLAQRVGALKVADGFSGESEIGPLIETEAVERVETHIADAVAKGARVLVGGQRHALGGTFFEPTVLCDVVPDALAFREETFGPLAIVTCFESEADAIRLANDTSFGLAAYFYTGNLSRAFRVAEGLHYGIVGINEGAVSTAVAPFGGVKQSGLGREGSKYGIEDYLEIKYLCFGIRE